jgi:FMN phosphatase YigB (HAD superfamily)
MSPSALFSFVVCKMSLQNMVKFLSGRVRHFSLRMKEESLYRSAKAMGLFHWGWYERRHGLKFASKKEAFRHYLRVSKFSNVSPCRAFDGETYLRVNGDCLEAGVSPLEHYINHGRAEKRPLPPVMDRWIPKDSLELDSDLSDSAKSMNVAVCLHIYYPDYAKRFASALRHFPIPFDLYIACGGKTQSKIAETFKALPNCRNLEIRECPNRGRNFGPMLVEFSKRLLEYDLLIHLHSKKSLYSGKDQHQWSNYLAEYLLRDTTIVGKALNAFAADPQLGVYYPTPFWQMPAWVNHWTRNKGQCASIFSKTGTVGIENNFLAYPVGGMFWARPAAIKALLSNEYCYEDFPAEPVPPDGTSLHALERLIGLIAERDGYRQLFFYPPRGTFTQDQSYIFAPYTVGSPWLLQQLSNHETISFDLFDTLVRRRFHAPDYAKLKVGKKLFDEGIVANPGDFVRLRNETEAKLRQQKDHSGDITLSEIAKALAAQLGMPDHEAERLEKMEFFEDYEMLISKDEMVDIFNALIPNRTMWIISDTYYNKRQISLILRKVGLQPPAEIFLSSDLQLRKDNGTMWKHIKNKLTGKNIKSYIHVGDNVVSDSQLAGDMGLRTFHLLHPLDKWQALGHSPVLRGTDEINEAHILKWGGLVSKLGRVPMLGE